MCSARQCGNTMSIPVGVRRKRSSRRPPVGRSPSNSDEAWVLVTREEPDARGSKAGRGRVIENFPGGIPPPRPIFSSELSISLKSHPRGRSSTEVAQDTRANRVPRLREPLGAQHPLDLLLRGQFLSSPDHA